MFSLSFSETNVTLPLATLRNGSLYLHVFLGPQGKSLTQSSQHQRISIITVPVTKYLVPSVAEFNLVTGEYEVSLQIIHSSIIPSIYLFICLSIYISIHPSFHLYISIHLSIHLYIHSSIIPYFNAFIFILQSIPDNKSSAPSTHWIPELSFYGVGEDWYFDSRLLPPELWITNTLQ